MPTSSHKNDPPVPQGPPKHMIPTDRGQSTPTGDSNISQLPRTPPPTARHVAPPPTKLHHNRRIRPAQHDSGNILHQAKHHSTHRERLPTQHLPTQDKKPVYPTPISGAQQTGPNPQLEGQTQQTIHPRRHADDRHSPTPVARTTSWPTETWRNTTISH